MQKGPTPSAYHDGRWREGHPHAATNRTECKYVKCAVPAKTSKTDRKDYLDEQDDAENPGQ